MNARDVPHVALNLRFHQVPIPCTTSRRVLPGKSRGISTANDTLRKCCAERLRQTASELAAKQSVEKAGACPHEFALRQRMKAQQTYPARQRISQLRDEQDICRTGEDEPSR